MCVGYQLEIQHRVRRHGTGTRSEEKIQSGKEIARDGEHTRETERRSATGQLSRHSRIRREPFQRSRTFARRYLIILYNLNIIIILYIFPLMFVYVVFVYITFTGTIIATLKRKSKSLEKIPMYEMVSFHRGSTIPTSHIHMYDPDNITIAISIFRVSRLNYTITKLYFFCFRKVHLLEKDLQISCVLTGGYGGISAYDFFLFLLFRIEKKIH